MIEKLDKIHKLADEAVASEDFVKKLGGIILYAGLADFMAIQSARLLEQVILKSQLIEGKKPSFRPREDSYFYDAQISTRRIVKEIKRHLPFKVSDSSEFQGDIQKINEISEAYLKSTEKFLNYRNPIVHHIGSPKKKEKDILELIDKAVLAFKEMGKNYGNFMSIMQPYRFSPKEYKYFYGDKEIEH